MCSNLSIYVTFQLEKVHLKLFPSKFIYDIDFKKTTTKESIALGSPWIRLLPQQCWAGQTRDLPSFSSLWSSSNPLFSCGPQDHLHATPCLQQQLTPGFVAGSLSPVNHELPDPPELFQKGQSYNHLPGQLHLWASCTSLFLGFHSNCKSVAGQRYWENARVPHISRKFKIRAVAESSSGTCRSYLKMSGVTVLVPRKRSWAQRKPWIRSCCESASPGFRPERCPLDFMKKPFLDHKVEFIKKDNHLTNSSGQPEAGLGETSLKCSPLSTTRSLQGHHLLKTCCSSLASGLPESLPPTT